MEYDFLRPDQVAYIKARIVEDGDCLRWTGGCAGKAKHPALPKSLQQPGKSSLVRRVLWEGKHGPIPTGKILRCTCGMQRCIDIAHCELSTFKKVALECGAMGLMSGPVRSAKIAATHRARHPLTRTTQEQVREIRASDEPGTVLAARYGVSEATISKYRLGHFRREFSGNVWAGLAA
jgi:hypothetical protein